MKIEQVRKQAKKLGFYDVRANLLKRPITAASRQVLSTRRYFLNWLKEGRHGEMRWLEKNISRRLNPREIMPTAKTILSFIFPYQTKELPPKLLKDSNRGIISRYALTDDYHRVLLEKLKKLVGWIEKNAGRKIEYKIYVDTGPLLERAIACEAGLGFVGKNTNLINPQIGSFVFIAEILTDLKFEPEKKITIKQDCGDCRACQLMCPTGAIISPRKIDARKCLAYLTIENKGVIPEKFRATMKNRIFGCDICQEVCPWNKKSKQKVFSKLKLHPEMLVPKLINLAKFSHADFLAFTKKSPMRRCGYEGFLRNVFVALGNSGDKKVLPVVEKGIKHQSALVREHAAWAKEKIKSFEKN